MEQSQQGVGCSCISVLSSCFWLCGVSYALCLLPRVLWSVVLLCPVAQVVLLFCSSACPPMFSLKELCLSEDLGFYSLFYLVPFCNALWDSLSGLMHSGIACLTSQAPDWAVAFWDACLVCNWLIYYWCPPKCVYCKLSYDWFPL